MYVFFYTKQQSAKYLKSVLRIVVCMVVIVAYKNKITQCLLSIGYKPNR